MENIPAVGSAITHKNGNKYLVVDDDQMVKVDGVWKGLTSYRQIDQKTLCLKGQKYNRLTQRGSFENFEPCDVWYEERSFDLYNSSFAWALCWLVSLILCMSAGHSLIQYDPRLSAPAVVVVLFVAYKMCVSASKYFKYRGVMKHGKILE